MHQSDLKLMQRIQTQDADSFDILFARYQERIARHVQSIVREKSATEDLVQEIFLRVWTRAEQWEAPSKNVFVLGGDSSSQRISVKPWLYRIATNLSLNHLRALQRRPQQPLEIPADELLGDQGAIFLPITEAGQLEADERLSLAGHLRRNGALLGQIMPRHESLWGLAYLSQTEEGHGKIEALVGRSVNRPDGFMTHTTLLETLGHILSAQGAERTLAIIDQLFLLGFVVAQESGFSMSGFVGTDLEAVAMPTGVVPSQWDASARQLTERLATVDANGPSLQSHLLAIKSGTRGEMGTLARIIGPQGIATDVYGNDVIVRHGYSEGLTAKELYGLVPASRERLASLAMRWSEIERPSFHLSSTSNIDHNFHVLARARRSTQPGIVFARAAAIGEVDPLVDQVSRLFVGLK